MSKSFDPHALEQVDSVEASAAVYFSLLRSSRATAQDYADFDNWYARDEAHRLAWARVEREWRQAGAMRSDPRILTIRERALANRRPRHGWLRPLAAAAAVLLVVAGGLAYHQLGRAPNPPTLMAGTNSRALSTDVGQQMTFRMVDGSTITANTASDLSIRESDTRRSVLLQQGEAYFDVAKNPQKPFTVMANGVKVTALGTAFSVREREGAVAVILVHGKVRVDMPAVGGDTAQSAILAPGRRLVWRNGQFSTEPVDAERELGWRTGMINFDRAPLENAVAEMNRYSTQKIVIVSSRIARYPISGSFRLGATRGFLQSLEVAGIARIGKENLASVELTAP
ncbi:MAG: DUF4880 domain-containing protein [Sphingomonadales bacterium]|nr:MAG: DUF4880 domain-containing protein [Sphingomonadales bacterium]TNF05788.1 MAG: DUF4880 domain-containing protein [Sphingomonadales bacterium]